jgi:hypothetical protein
LVSQIGYRLLRKVVVCAFPMLAAELNCLRQSIADLSLVDGGSCLLPFVGLTFVQYDLGKVFIWLELC